MSVLVNKKLSIIVFSGTLDKLIPVGILSSAAAAGGYQVNLFFTFWGLNAITKRSLQSQPKLDKNYEEYASAIGARMREMKFPAWYELIRQAKEVGEVKVYACSTTMEFFGIKKEDLADFVDDIVGAATFLDRAEGGITLFI